MQKAGAFPQDFFEPGSFLGLPVCATYLFPGEVPRLLFGPAPLVSEFLESTMLTPMSDFYVFSSPQLSLSWSPSSRLCSLPQGGLTSQQALPHLT